MSYEIEKRHRYYLDAESGPHTFQEGGGFRVCLVYPNTYNVGMSNLGLQINLAQVSEVAGVTVERAFLPDADLMNVFGPGRSSLVSLESRRPLSQFHVIAFSITYEMDYLNVVRILSLAGIEPLKEQRKAGDPLVIAGGAAVTANPFSMEALFDLSWIGESEAGVKGFFEAVRDGYGTPNLLDDLARLPHVFVPGQSIYRDVYGSIQQFELDDHPAVSRVITPHTAFSSTALMEVTRGCKWPCRFCIARTLYGSARILKAETILDQARLLREWTDKIGLFGAGISDYPDLAGLISGLAGEGFTVNTSSLRFTAMSNELIRALEMAGQKTLTVAPESFSLKILKVLAKGLNDAYLHQGLENIIESHIERIKVYHIIGVQGESEEDHHKTLEYLQPYGKRSNNIQWELGYSILEPKPHTPFEDWDLAEKSAVEQSIKYIRKTMHRIGRVKISYPSYAEVVTCDWLCRGDSRVGRHVVEALQGDPHAKFRLPRRVYRQDMDEMKSQGFPWSIFSGSMRDKDQKQVIAHKAPTPRPASPNLSITH